MRAATRMITTTPTAMTTELSPAQLMTVTQWLSPGFPVGAFSYSHGLEGAFDADPTLELEPYLTDLLRFGAGRSDAILLRAGYDGQAEEADTLGRALAPSAGRLLETDQLGAAFCKALTAFGINVGPFIYPVAIGAAAQAKSLPLGPIVPLYLHAFTANLIACAQRLSPLGQTAAQAMLDRLSPVCLEVAEAAKTSDLDDLGGSTWAADTHAMRHETMASRIFRT